MSVQDWLTQARDRAEAATEGPWVASLAGRGARVSEPSGYSLPGCFTCGQNEDGIYEPPDAAFIAAARTDLPAALDAIQAVLDLTTAARARHQFGRADTVSVWAIKKAITSALGVSE